MRYPFSKIVKKTNSKIKTTNLTKKRLILIASFIIIALMSSAAFSSNLGINSLKDLLFNNQTANLSDLIISPVTKSNALSTSQPISAPAFNENPVNDVAMVTTDRTDYNPGETVVITGSGFDAFENVSLEIMREGVEAATYQVAADQYGNIFNREFVISEDDLGASFGLTATGATSGKVASSQFTDGAMSYTPVNQTYINTGAIVSSASSQNISFSQSVIGANGSPNIFTVAPTITRQSAVFSSVNYVALPVSYGVSVSPNSLSYCNGGGCPSNTQAWTVSITVPANAVPVGGPTLRYSVNVKATPNVSGHTAGNGTTIFLEIKAPAPADTTAPTTTLTSGTYVNNAWTNQDVTVDLSAADNAGGSGVQNLTYTVTGPGGIPVTTVVSGSPFTASIPVSAEGNTTIAYFAKDNANNTENTQYFYVNIDKTKPVITLTDGDITLPYGSTFTEPGFSASDDRAPTDLTANVVVSGSVDTNVVADYVLTYNVSDSAGNAADQKTRTVHVVKANATIDVQGYTGTYDGNAHGATGSATGVNSENLNSLLDLGSSFTDAPGGTANWTFAGNDNYNSTGGSVEIVINKADATIDVQAYTGTYDGNAHGATGSATGVNSEDLSAGLNLGDSFTNVSGGTANWTFTGGTNYNDDNGSVEIVINKANADCGSISGSTSVYDGNSHGASGSCTGVGGVSDVLDGLDLGSSFTDVPGGTAIWTFNDSTGNYNNTNGSVEIVINKADATIDVQAYTGTYDGNAHGATGSATGVNSEDLSAGLNLGDSFTNVSGGTANWTFTGGTNYNDDNGSVEIVINKASSSTLVTCPTNVTYTGSALEPCSVSVTGAGGVDLTPANPTLSYLNNTNAGTASASYTFDGDDNHNDSSDSKNFEIDKAPTVVTVTFEGGPYVYRGTPFTATAQVTGAGNLMGSVAVVYSGDCTNVTVANGCMATATYNESANHLGNTDTKSITISQRQVTVKADNQSKILNAPDPSLTYQVTAGSVVSGDAFSGTLTRNPGESVGSYPITKGTLSLGNNYNLTFENGTLTITYATGGLCMGSPGHQILEPINANGLSVFKQKSTVPAKFRVCDANGVSIGSSGLVTSFQLIQVINGTMTATVTEDVVSTTPDTTFRWSSSDMQWIFNINTKNLSANRTYVYRVMLNDGSNIDFGFGLK